MDYKDQKMINALESIARELSLVNEKLLNRIANSAIAVMPGVSEEITDDSVCSHVDDCEHVTTLQKVVEAYEKRLKEVEARNEALKKENENYHSKLHEYEKRLKDLIFNQGEPKKPLEKPYHKGMEVTTFGAN